jgi:hypothetical protein
MAAMTPGVIVLPANNLEISGQGSQGAVTELSEETAIELEEHP